MIAQRIFLALRQRWPLLVSGPAAALFLYVAWTDIDGLVRSPQWPRTLARITWTDARREVRNDFIFPRYRPVVEYHYFVKGTEYHNNMIGFGWSQFYTEDAARESLKKYPVGSSIPVSYDPASPSRACLEPAEPGSSTLLFMIVGGVLALFFMKELASEIVNS